MNDIKIAVELNTGATVAVLGSVVTVCSTGAWLLSRPHAVQLLEQIPATVSAMPSARQEIARLRPQLRETDDVA